MTVSKELAVVVHKVQSNQIAQLNTLHLIGETWICILMSKRSFLILMEV